MDPNKIDFIGIGAERCGSTWISKCLKEHPEILFSSQKSVKEVNFFKDHPREKVDWMAINYQRRHNYQKGLKWYLNHFPDPQPGKIRGEFSPGYLRDPKSSARIKKHFPNIKLIVVLRNPVDMIYSLYWYARKTFRVQMPRDFDKAVEKEREKRLWLNRGKYYSLLKRYYDKFDQSQIHVILFDDIKSKPVKVVNDLYEFLGVDNRFRPSVLGCKVNSSKMPRFGLLSIAIFKMFKFMNNPKLRLINRFSDWLCSRGLVCKAYGMLVSFAQKRADYPEMKQKTKKRLLNYYEKDIKKLSKLINKDLSSWLKP